MRVFLIPTGLHSRAMIRVAEALAKYAPEEVEIVHRRRSADIEVLHVIGSDVFEREYPLEYVVIQYCYKSSLGREKPEKWKQFWRNSRFVWSYYDLDVEDVPFYFSPLGVDGNVFQNYGDIRNSVLTSGFVNGPHAEPIAEMAFAAADQNLPVIHIGPSTIEGMQYYPPRFTNFLGISDPELVSLYNKSLWVSGMRYTEGFELPILEGLACGARPICFDREDMHRWYNGHAVFVPELKGHDLRDTLAEVLENPPSPVSSEERDSVLKKFDWSSIAQGFWQHMNV